MNNSKGSTVQEVYFESTGKTKALIDGINAFVSNSAQSLLIMSCDYKQSSLNINLKGENEQIIHEAGQATFELKNRLNKNNSTYLLFDCISRAALLGDKLNNKTRFYLEYSTQTCSCRVTELTSCT